MFNKIPSAILKRMKYLEDRDRNEMVGKIDMLHFNKLRQIPPETGRFISLMAACSSPDAHWLEIGTSAGYSTLWLTLACKQLNTRISTFELNPQKIELAKETFLQSDVQQYVELIAGNVLDHLSNYTEISFCFLDTEKELYAKCYEIVIPNMIAGGILLADNVISHQVELQSMIDIALADERVAATIVPVGEGILMCRRI
jgi:predicted O-methyltransferase YrrM